MNKKKADSELSSIQQKNLMFNESEKLAGVGSWIWDVENDIWTFSENWYAIHGISKKPISTSELLKIAHTSDQSTIQNSLYNTKENQIPYEIEYRIIKQNTNEKGLIKAYGKVSETKNGRVSKITGAVLDITDQITIEKELKTALEKAEESDRLKTLFLNNMSHEIRTPLNGVLGFAKLLNKENLDPETREDYIQIVHESGNRLTRVVENIIDISMIESDQMEFNPQKLKISELFKDIHSEHENSMLLNDNQDIKLVFGDNINESTQVIADKLRIKQVINNFITNAMECSQSGNIELGCLQNKDQMATIYVKDEGPGIPKNQQHKLFKRFSKVETGEMNEGIGVGLAISKGIVELHGGEIWYEENTPKGSIFSFTLNIDSSQKESIMEDTNQTKVTKDQNNLIYIAEDDEISTDYLQAILSEIDVEMEFAQNGKELLQLMENKIPQLVLMDIKMPIMNGFEALSQIREKYPDVKVIAQTAHAMGNEKQRIKEAGFDDYISKPIDEDNLFRLVKKYI